MFLDCCFSCKEGEESEYAYQYNTEPQKGFNSVTVTEGSASMQDTLEVLTKSQNHTKKRGFQPRGKTLVVLAQ